jgi:hypothetical protein
MRRRPIRAVLALCRRPYAAPGSVCVKVKVKCASGGPAQRAGGLVGRAGVWLLVGWGPVGVLSSPGRGISYVPCKSSAKDAVTVRAGLGQGVALVTTQKGGPVLGAGVSSSGGLARTRVLTGHTSGGAVERTRRELFAACVPRQVPGTPLALVEVTPAPNRATERNPLVPARPRGNRAGALRGAVRAGGGKGVSQVVACDGLMSVFGSLLASP